MNEDGAKIYWLNGMAGTGKTTIAYSLCERLKSCGALGASYFCSRSIAETRDPEHIFPTIAYELAQLSPAISEALKDAINRDPDIGHRNLEEQFVQLILHPTKAAESFLIERRTTVACDAFDELKHQKQVTEVLTILSRYADELPVKFFISSRPEREIEDHFEVADGHEKMLLHNVEKDIVSADIRLYLLESFEEMTKKFRTKEIWPSMEDVDLLVAKAGALFIYAATVCLYVGGGYKESGVKARLKDVVENTQPMSSRLRHGTYHALDELYTDILKTAYEGDLNDIEDILRAVVALRNPLPVEAISRVLDEDEHVVFEALSYLHSVIAVPEEDERDEPVTVFHASFPDFLADPQRSCKFYLDPAVSHQMLAERCLRIIQSELKNDNVCKLGGKNVPIAAITRSIVKTYVSDALEYACTFWLSHLAEANSLESLEDPVMEFFDELVLRWIECMSLLGKLDLAVMHLRKVEILEKVMNDYQTEIFLYSYFFPLQASPELRFASMDARRLILRCYDTIRDHPLETYYSALVWLPKTSRIRQKNRHRVHWEVVYGLEEWWDTCESVLKGHTQMVTSVAFSKDGRMVVSGSDDRSVRIWNVETGKEVRTVKEHHLAKVTSVAFSPCGRRVVSASRDNTIRILNIESCKEERVIEGHSSTVTCVAFSPDGAKLVSGSQAADIRIWDVATGQKVKVIEGHLSTVTSVAFSADGKEVVSGSDDRFIRVWDVETCRKVKEFRGHSARVNSVAFSNDGKQVVSGLDDKTIQVWNVKREVEELVLRGHTARVSSVAFSPDGKWVVSGSNDRTVRLWNVAGGGAQEMLMEGHGHAITSVAFSPDGRRVVSGAQDTTIRVWNVEVREKSRAVQGTVPVISVSFSQDGHRLVSGCNDKSVRIWSVETGEEMLLQGHAAKVNSVAFSSDGRRVISGSDDKTIRIWNADSGTKVKQFKKQSAKINSVAFSNDGRRVVGALDDKGVKIWSCNGDEEKTLKGHSEQVTCVAFSPDGRWVVSGSDDRTIRIWDVESGKREKMLKGHDGRISCVAFSQDSSRLASGSEDGTVRLWKVKNGKEERVMQGHCNSITSVAFSVKGSRVISVSLDQTIRIWNYDTGREEKAECLFSHPLQLPPIYMKGRWLYCSSHGAKARCWLANLDFRICTTHRRAICLAFHSGHIMILKPPLHLPVF
jgi:WD40 repeat protein